MAMVEWRCTEFTDLSGADLYKILQLRAAVFVLEQECLYQDLDDYDQLAQHLSGWRNDSLLCYARLLPPGAKYATPSLGRIVTSMAVRGEGLGKILLEKGITACTELWPAQGITISAQQYLERFYQDLGFTTTSAAYLEDGIPHIEMTRPP